MHLMCDESQSWSPAPAGPVARVIPGADDSAGVDSGDSVPVVPQTLDSTAETQTGNIPAAGAEGVEARGSSRTAQLTTTLENVLGVMPEWLQDLREASRRRDAPTIVQVCTCIADHARLMRADQLARRSETLAGLAADGILDQSDGFVREIDAEFQRWFRELLASRQRSI
jgi:hypothetical protein